MSARAFMTNASVRHQVYMLQYGNERTAALAKFLERAIATARGRLSEGLSPFASARYQEQIDVLRADLEEVYGAMEAQMRLSLSDLTRNEIEFNGMMLDESTKASVTISTPPPQTVVAAAFAKPLELEARQGVQRISIRGALAEFSQKKTAEILSEIAIGASLGETNDAITTRLLATTEMQRRNLAAIVNTSIAHISSVAREQVMEANQDLLAGMRAIATLDSKTSPGCRARDQEVIPLGSPMAPFHWNCRTTMIPEIKPEFARQVPGSTRPAVGAEGAEQVSSRQSYGEWLADQPEEFQVDVLGPARQKLFAKGGLDMDRFVNDEGQQITLEELRRKNPTAFKRAGL